MPIFQKVYSLGENMPYKATTGSRGFDIRGISVEYDEYKNPHLPISVKTGVILKWGQEQYYQENISCIVRSKSGLYLKHGIEVFHGLIDMDYQKEIILLFKKTYGAVEELQSRIKKGNPVAQLVFTPDVELVRCQELPQSTHGGFDSTKD